MWSLGAEKLRELEICYSYTTSCCGLSGIHEAVIQLEAEAQPRLLIE